MEVTDRRTKADWAGGQATGKDEDYPHKDRIVLVMDNLNTHHPAHCMKPLSLPKRGASPNGWRSITQAWQPVGWSMAGDRNRGDGPAMPEPPYSRPSCWAELCGGRLGAWQQQRNRDATAGGLALHHLGCPIKLKSPLPTCNTDGLRTRRANRNVQIPRMRKLDDISPDDSTPSGDRRSPWGKGNALPP